MRRFVFSLAIAGCAVLAPFAARGDDQQIAQTVMQKLAQEKQAGNLRGFGIELQVDDGTVYMKGRVSSPEQQTLALECAQRTAGVKEVVNELRIGQSVPAQPVSTAGTLQPVSTGSRSGANQTPRAFAPAYTVAMRNQVGEPGGMAGGGPVPQYLPGSSGGVTPAQYDHPQMPGYAWPAYASHPNYAAVTYPKQYSPTAWPYIGPFYPYPQVPLGWRKVTLEWDDGWWMLDFQDKKKSRN